MSETNEDAGERRSRAARAGRTRVESQRGSNGERNRGKGRSSVGNLRPHRRKRLYRRHTNCLVAAVPIRTMCCAAHIVPQQSAIIPI